MSKTAEYQWLQEEIAAINAMPNTTSAHSQAKVKTLNKLFQTIIGFSNTTFDQLRQTKKFQTLLRDKCVMFQSNYNQNMKHVWYLANWSPTSKCKLHIARCVFLTDDSEWCNAKLHSTEILCRAHKIWLNASFRATRDVLPNELSYIVVEYIQNEFRLLFANKRKRLN